MLLRDDVLVGLLVKIDRLLVWGLLDFGHIYFLFLLLLYLGEFAAEMLHRIRLLVLLRL